MSSAFCSQLVAATLRKLDIFPGDIIPDNFLPGTLSQPYLNVGKHVKLDPMIRFSFLEAGDSRTPEHPFVEKASVKTLPEFGFGVHAGRLNASWKGLTRGSLVNVIGVGEFGALLVKEVEGGVPSAFVDRENTEEKKVIED